MKIEILLVIQFLPRKKKKKDGRLSIYYAIRYSIQNIIFAFFPFKELFFAFFRINVKIEYENAITINVFVIEMK